MIVATALLENWMRRYYFDTEIDIGSSGVYSFSMAELKQLVGLSQEEIDGIVFDDSKTLGGTGLREAIAGRWGGGDAERVIATHGSSEAIFLTMHALVRPGDEVLVLDPVYQQFHSLAESAGGLCKPWPLRFEQKFAPDVEEAKRLIGDRTKMVVVNFPHNPTGASVSPAECEELVRAASRVGAYLVWDAAFSDITYDGPPLPDPSAGYERAVSLGTLSKSYGLPGLRLGWCLASREVLEQFVHLRDYLTLHLSPLVELVAQRVIERADALLDIRRREAHANRATLLAWAEENGELVEVVPPGGGVCVFPRLRGVSDVEAFCHRLAQEFKVLLVPGNCFGRPEHVRLGFGGRPPELSEGLSRLSGLLKTYAA